MRDAYVVLALCLAAIGVGCGLYFFGPQLLHDMQPRTSSDETPRASGAEEEQEPAVAQGSVEFSILGAGVYAGSIEERKNYVVSGDEAVAELWKMIYGSDVTAPPQLDSSEYVIGVFAGTKPSGGYGIEVAEVIDTASQRIVIVEVTEPGEGCMTTQALTSPYQLIRLPASALPLAHENRVVTTDCN